MDESIIIFLSECIIKMFVAQQVFPVDGFQFQTVISIKNPQGNLLHNLQTDEIQKFPN